MSFWGCKATPGAVVGSERGAGLATSSWLTALSFHCPDEGRLRCQDINGRDFFSNLLGLFPLRNIDFSLHSAWGRAE